MILYESKNSNLKPFRTTKDLILFTHLLNDSLDKKASYPENYQQFPRCHLQRLPEQLHIPTVHIPFLNKSSDNILT